MMLYRVAKAIRVITVPPLMVTGALLLLWQEADVFPHALDFFLALFFLAILPVLAYPVQMLVPKWREGGRNMQRKLAFLFSAVGYVGAVICAIVRGAVPNLLYIAVVYCLSVILLLLFNSFTPLHASGHGCSIAGPIIFSSCFVGGVAIFPLLFLYAASLWASAYMKRHTVREFLLGTLIAAASAAICYFVIHPVF